MKIQNVVESVSAPLGRPAVAQGSLWRRIAIALTVALVAICMATGAFASQLVLNSTGGAMMIGTDFVLSGATVANPAGTLSIDCPITSIGNGTYLVTYNCSGGSFSYQSNDGTTTVSASFGTAAAYLSASGGGRGGNIHYYYTFSGNFSGTQTVNGVTAAIRGETNETMQPVTSASGSAPACCGAAGVNSAYTPVYITNYSFSQLVRADDLWGTNAQTLGGTGTGAKQFYGPHGVTVDSSGRIYVADTYNCRIDRMDDITGANWTTFGTCGSGAKQFSTGGLADLAVDSSGRIYVADPGNGRIDRFDDMTGTNWTSFSSVGANVLSGAQGVAVDSAGKIYIADTGNRRLVRIDDMTGTNWTALTQSPPIGIYIYTFGSPAHVAIDPAGRIEVGDGNNVIRVDDMTGANWVSTNTGSAVQGLSVDAGGTTFIANIYSLAMLDDVATGAGFNTSNFVSQAGGIYAVPVQSPVPAVTVAPSTLTFATQNTGTSSAAQNVMLTNFGESTARHLEHRDHGGLLTDRQLRPHFDCGVELHDRRQLCAHEDRKGDRHVDDLRQCFHRHPDGLAERNGNCAGGRHCPRFAGLPAAGDQHHQRPATSIPEQHGHRCFDVLRIGHHHERRLRADQQLRSRVGTADQLHDHRHLHAHCYRS